MSISYKLSPLVGYHGCEREVAEKVLFGECHLRHSENDYDWLGAGIYFWVDSFERAWSWAQQNRNIADPYVVGAFIDPGFCMNLTDFGVTGELRMAYEELVKVFRQAEVELPKNIAVENEIFNARKLDCAVINFAHQLREENSNPKFDTVYGVFEEGEPLYTNSALREKTHVQISVRNIDAVTGYFRPKELVGNNG